MALYSSAMERATRKLRKFLRKRRGQLSPEHVHKLRTTIRRIETGANAALAKVKKADQRVLDDAASIRKRAGKVRDMDVLTANAMSLATNKKKDGLIELVQYLGVQRYDEAKRLRSIMRNNRKNLEKGLKRFSSRINRKVRKQDCAMAKNATGQAVAVALQSMADLKSPGRLNHSNLHAYRLKVKKLRDIIRLAEPPGQPRLVAALGQVKNAIGDWHDWEVLASIGNEVLAHSAGELLRRIRAVTAKKFDYAVSVTLKMRSTFLRSRKAKTSSPALKTAALVA